jgi:hypothetical protein
MSLVRRERDRALPWRVSLSFNVSQVGSEAPLLLRQVFGVGTVRGRGDGVYYYEVTRASHLEGEGFPPSSSDSRCGGRRRETS